MENYDNFFNFNDQGRTPVYHTPDPVDPKDNKSGKKFTVITVLFVVIALIMCIAIVANVVVLASMKTQVSQDYADSMVDAVREEYIKAIEEYLEGKEITEDVLAQIRDEIGHLRIHDVGPRAPLGIFTLDEHGAHSGATRALKVVKEVADVDAAARFRAYRLRRGVEGARVRLDPAGVVAPPRLFGKLDAYHLCSAFYDLHAVS